MLIKSIPILVLFWMVVHAAPVKKKGTSSNAVTPAQRLPDSATEGKCSDKDLYLVMAQRWIPSAGSGGFKLHGIWGDKATEETYLEVLLDQNNNGDLPVSEAELAVQITDFLSSTQSIEFNTFWLGIGSQTNQQTWAHEIFKHSLDFKSLAKTCYADTSCSTTKRKRDALSSSSSSTSEEEEEEYEDGDSCELSSSSSSSSSASSSSSSSSSTSSTSASEETSTGTRTASQSQTGDSSGTSIKASSELMINTAGSAMETGKTIQETQMITINTAGISKASTGQLEIASTVNSGVATSVHINTPATTVHIDTPAATVHIASETVEIATKTQNARETESTRKKHGSNVELERRGKGKKASGVSIVDQVVAAQISDYAQIVQKFYPGGNIKPAYNYESSITANGIKPGTWYPFSSFASAYTIDANTGGYDLACTSDGSGKQAIVTEVFQYFSLEEAVNKQAIFDKAESATPVASNNLCATGSWKNNCLCLPVSKGASTGCTARATSGGQQLCAGYLTI
ncbi:hypothetical protein DASC09_054020 [Saccharomycopsis crataegensis]|uniref:Uncharacterized protein n=1 Tax=Saccharomycopsis crataegensis TaxID=43959 RepID=A0AAV5QUJ9_9ASCO|nr:hypothetical protein DASC09_054020 [Saccharomycopsis crataegensis]